MSYSKLKILCDTTFDEYPDSSIEHFVRDAVVEHEKLLEFVNASRIMVNSNYFIPSMITFERLLNDFEEQYLEGVNDD